MSPLRWGWSGRGAERAWRSWRGCRSSTSLHRQPVTPYRHSVQYRGIRLLGCHRYHVAGAMIEAKRWNVAFVPGKRLYRYLDGTQPREVQEIQALSVHHTGHYTRSDASVC